MTTNSRARLKGYAEDYGWAYSTYSHSAKIYHPLYGTKGHEMDSNDCLIEVWYAQGNGRVRAAFLVYDDGSKERIDGGVRGIFKVMDYLNHYANDTGCPDPRHCEHTTYVGGESCECCGLEIGEGDH